MTSFQEYSIVVILHVTAISLSAGLMMLLSRKNAARRHSAGLIGLMLVLSSPLWAAILPQTGLWRWGSHADGPPSISLEASAVRQRQPYFDESISKLSDSPPIEVSAAEQVQASVLAKSTQAGTGGKSHSDIETDESSARFIGIRKISPSKWLNLAGAVWIAGSVVLVLRWLWQIGRLRSIVHSLSNHTETNSNACDAVADDVCRAVHISRMPPIVISDLVPMAMVLGMWRPRIVLPHEVVKFSEANGLREVLIHECAHIVRRDPWVNAAQRLAGVLWWWHPGVLWLNPLLARSREEICDNFVLQHGDAPEYAQTLLKLTEHCSSRRNFAPALGILGPHWTLEERITEILKPERNTMTQTKRQTVVLIAALLGTICLLVGGVRGLEEPQAKSDAKKQLDVTLLKSAIDENTNTLVRPETTHSRLKDKVANQVSNEEATRENGIAARKADMRSISGRVVDEQDRPVAGAQLWWVVSRGNPHGVIVNGVSDHQGRFSLSTPNVATPRSLVSDELWIFQQEKQLAAVTAASKTAVDGTPRELLVRLQPKTDTSFVVMSPVQKPLTGAKVDPYYYHTPPAYDILPAQVREILSATTDTEGRVQMPHMARKGNYSVRVTSSSFGTQEFRMGGNPNPAAERTIELQATGRIEGQIKTSNPEWVRGVPLRFRTLNEGEWLDTNGDSKKLIQKADGYASVTTDDQGRFTVPTIAPGRIQFGFETPIDAPALPRLPSTRVVIAGASEKLEITLEPPVAVRGSIRTHDTDKPIPGAEISVCYGQNQSVSVLSDAKGRYEAQVLVGPVFSGAVSLPNEFSKYASVGSPWNGAVDVRADATPFELPTIRLLPTIPLKGILVDQFDRPVSKVLLSGSKGNRRYGSARTNENGEFSMQIPKTISLERYQFKFDEDTPFVEPTIEKRDPLILRVTLPRT